MKTISLFVFIIFINVMLALKQIDVKVALLAFIAILQLYTLQALYEIASKIDKHKSPKNESCE